MTDTSRNASPYESAEELWSDVLEELRGKVSTDNFEAWFTRLHLVGLGDETATIEVEDDFVQAWIEDNYRDLIEKALADLVGRAIDVEICVDEDSSEEPTEEPEPEVLQLNLWKRDERPAPNPILRSALFGVVQRGRRRHCSNELLESWKGVDLIYSGKKLNQNDLDVWLQLIHLHRGGELGEPVAFTFRGLLRDLDRNTGGSAIEWLRTTIRRLNKGHIELSTDRYVYGGHLIHDYGWDDYTGDFTVTLNPRLVAFFAYDDFTRLEWETRLSFSKSYTRWLHGFIASHHAPPDDPDKIRLQKLKELSDSKISRFRDFRAKVRASMKELEEAGIVTAWRITDRDILKYANTRRLSDS